MIKQLLNLVLAKYCDLSMAHRSSICHCLRHRQIIDLLATDKSQYFARPRPIILLINDTITDNGIQFRKVYHRTHLSFLPKKQEITTTVAKLFNA